MHLPSLRLLGFVTVRASLSVILLMVMGVTAAHTQADDIAALRADIARQAKIIAEMEKRLQELEAKQQQNKTVNAPQPVVAGAGSVRAGGLIQNWYGSDSRGVDSFRLRRMELSLAGQITPRTAWRVMIDPAKPLVVQTTTTAGGNVTDVSVNQASRILQDSVVTHVLTPGLSLDIGQYKVPLSRESLRSSSELLTVERSLMNTLPVNRGRIADARDIGAQVRQVSSRTEVTVGVFNGGLRQNSPDDTEQKALMGRFVYRPVEKARETLHVGIYGAKDGTAAARRDRLGGEAAYRIGPHTLEAEIAEAKDNSPTLTGRGGYLIYAYTLSDAWQGVLREDRWDPNTSLGGDEERDLTLGVNYFIRGRNAKIQFNVIRKSIGGAAPDFLGDSRTQYLLNAQTAW